MSRSLRDHHHQQQQPPNQRHSYIIILSTPVYMRFQSFSTIFRTFCTFTNATSHVVRPTQPSISPFLRGTVLRSMPTIPFLGSLFSSSSAGKMSYPLKKSEDEWSAVLNKGNKYLLSNPYLGPDADQSPFNQNNSVFFAKRAPKPRTPAPTTNTCRRAASTRALPAPLRSTKPRTSSNPAVAGRPTLTQSPAR